MENSIEIFKNETFGEIRVVEVEGEPWFVGKDIASVLGYSNPQKAIRDHVDEDDKTVNELFTVNGTKGILINESGLYSLILSSKLPSAKKFKSWVTGEVLPSIRKTGAYIVRREPTQFEIDELEFKKQDLIARKAELWMKLGESTHIEDYRQICNSYAARELAGKDEFILPLPVVEKKSYTATEIGQMLGISAHKVGKLANQHELKIDKYGKWFYDKSSYSKKEVESFRYYDSVIDVLKSYL